MTGFVRGHNTAKSSSISISPARFLDLIEVLPGSEDGTYTPAASRARHRPNKSALFCPSSPPANLPSPTPHAASTFKHSRRRYKTHPRWFILPRWLRSLRGLAVLVSVVFAVTVYIRRAGRTRSAAWQERHEAELAAIIEAGIDEEILAYELSEEIRNTTTAHTTAFWPFSRSDNADSNDMVQREHRFHKNGLLIAEAGAQRHPIYDLIAKGDRDWKALNARQSRTLHASATEYRRRYKRHPPKGFAKWWRYAQRNSINLPDEYDQIDSDLAPFRALEPSVMRHLVSALQGREQSFTIAIINGEVMIEGPFAHLRRATDMADIIRRFSRDLPHNVNMTFIVEDSPAIMLQHETRSRMTELGQEGEHFGPSDYVGNINNENLSNYAKACPEGSALRRKEVGEDVTDATSDRKTFIHDPIKANDLCEHPDFKNMHGHTVVNGTNLTPLLPLFSWAKMPTHSDILVTPLEQYWDQYDGYDPNWNQKSQNKLLWRGSTTGADFTVDSPWRQSQRARLHYQSRETEGKKSVMWADEEGRTQFDDFDNQALNEMYMDTSFSGAPAQCDPETCEIMRKEIDFAGLQGLDDSYQYKYMIDVDGNAWSGRFHRLMSTKSLVLKSTVFPEWYQARLIPWYHYIPVKIDYSDLYDILAFFIGTPDGRGSHDMLANKLAQNGKDWAKRNWRRVDMASYMYRLILEYSRLLNPEDHADYFD